MKNSKKTVAINSQKLSKLNVLEENQMNKVNGGEDSPGVDFGIKVGEAAIGVGLVVFAPVEVTAAGAALLGVGIAAAGWATARAVVAGYDYFTGGGGSTVDAKKGAGENGWGTCDVFRN